MPSKTTSSAQRPAPATRRILSIDIFRGLTIAFMIIVNTAGNGDVAWAPLKHAAWHGFTPTDLVFPSFLFIIGVSAWFSLKKYRIPGAPSPWGKIAKRTIVIFLIGMLMWYVPGLLVALFTGKLGEFVPVFVKQVRVLGVLGRLALCYGIGSALALSLSRRGLIWACAGLLLGYWGLMWFFGEGTDRYSLLTNAALRFDMWLLGPDHLYHGERVDGHPFAFDPEGVLSTLPAIVTYVIGYRTGEFLDTTPDRRLALSELFPAAFLLIVSGFLWDYWLGFPINKKIWTSSYTLFVGGLSLTLLSMTLWWVDVKGRGRSFRFFEIFGRNPLLAYVASEMGVTLLDMLHFSGSNGASLTGSQWIYQHLCVAWFGDNGLGSFVYSVTYMLSIWILSWLAFKRGWLIKIS